MEVKAKSRFTERYYMVKYIMINICYAVIYFHYFWWPACEPCSVVMGCPTLYKVWWGLEKQER